MLYPDHHRTGTHNLEVMSLKFKIWVDNNYAAFVITNSFRDVFIIDPFYPIAEIS